MKSLKRITFLAILTLMCASVVFGADDKKRKEINEYFASWDEAVTLAEKSATKKNKADYLKAEGWITGLNAKYPLLKISHEWNTKDDEKYKKYVSRYGKAKVEFGKQIGKDTKEIFSDDKKDDKKKK